MWKPISHLWKCCLLSVASVSSQPWLAWLRRWPTIAHTFDTALQEQADQRTAALMGAVSSDWLLALRADAEWIGTTWQADKLQRGPHD